MSACPQCSQENKEGTRFCIKCGASLEAPAQDITMDEESIVHENKDDESVENVVPEAHPEHSEIQDNEPESALASGLPIWSIEPPAVVVRRKARAI